MNQCSTLGCSGDAAPDSDMCVPHQNMKAEATRRDEYKRSAEEARAKMHAAREARRAKREGLK